MSDLLHECVKLQDKLRMLEGNTRAILQEQEARIAELESENRRLKSFRDAVIEISESGAMHSGEAMNLQDIASDALGRDFGLDARDEYDP